MKNAKETQEQMKRIEIWKCRALEHQVRYS